MIKKLIVAIVTVTAFFILTWFTVSTVEVVSKNLDANSKLSNANFYVICGFRSNEDQA